MNPKLFLFFFSFKDELKYVVLAFLIALSVPFIAVILLTHVGIDIISDRLATVNESSNTVQIHDPATGEVVNQLQITAAWPTTGLISLEFGQIDLPYQPLHTGIDIASVDGKIGNPVTAFMPGKVIYAGEIWWGYGKHIIIDHGNNITSVYAHLDKIFVVKGQEIKTNTHVIGRMGTTGWSTGPHLHFEIRVFGIPVNPRTFLQDNPSS